MLVKYIQFIWWVWDQSQSWVAKFKQKQGYKHELVISPSMESRITPSVNWIKGLIWNVTKYETQKPKCDDNHQNENKSEEINI